MAGAPGKRAEIALLAFAGLIVGADAAVDGDVSQLDPQICPRFERSKYGRIAYGKQCLK